MALPDFQYRKVCIFGYGKYAKDLHDKIAKLDTGLQCIFCDNDGNKHVDEPVEVVAPSVAVDRLMKKKLDAIIIPGTYGDFTRHAMLIQLSFLGASADEVYIADEDLAMGGDCLYRESLHRLADVSARVFFGNGIFGNRDLKDVFCEVGTFRLGIQAEIDKLTSENSIDGKRRIIVFFPIIARGANNGDVWYFLSRVPAYERKNDCRLVILIDSNVAGIIRNRAKFLEYDGYTFEFLEVRLPLITSILRSNIIHTIVLFRLSEFFETNKFRVFYPGNTNGFTRFFTNNDPENVGEVRSPRFPKFNKQHYIDTYDVKPGKTFWIIPESTWVKPFPPSYWNAVAAILRNIGFTVVFNSKKSEYDGALAFIPWEDIVGFAELCGHVIGTRSGFFDFAIIAKANFYIFAPPMFCDVRVEDVFGVDNSDGHVHTIPIESAADFSNLPELSYFQKVRKNFVEYLFELSCEMSNYIVFITSKFSHCPPQPFYESKILKALSLLNLQFDFSLSYGWSYCAVINGGSVIVEKHSADKRVAFVYSFDGDGHKAEIISEGLYVDKELCKASVIIDGVETCVNKRGLNIVLWDKTRNMVKESVVFNMLNDSPSFDSDTLGNIANGMANR